MPVAPLHQPGAPQRLRRLDPLHRQGLPRKHAQSIRAAARQRLQEGDAVGRQHPLLQTQPSVKKRFLAH
jgi:hypothetical protein